MKLKKKRRVREKKVEKMNLEEIKNRAYSFFKEKGIDVELIDSVAGRGWAIERTEIILKTIGIKTRVIVEDFQPRLSIKFLGKEISSPIMPAPLSGIIKAIDKNCFLKIVNESKEAGVFPWIGYPLQKSDVASLSDFIWIIKPLKDRKRIYDEIEIAEEKCFAVGLDLDAFGYEKIGWKIYPYEFLKPLSFNELKDIVASTRLPFIAKGILNEKDYELAVNAGCSAAVLSCRGGRILESPVSPLEIIQKIDKRVETGIDSFLKSGEDVFKALALGADFVLVGRPIIYGLTIDGGVKAVLEYLKSDLSRVMRICGTRNVSEINKSCLEFL